MKASELFNSLLAEVGATAPEEGGSEVCAEQFDAALAAVIQEPRARGEATPQGREPAVAERATAPNERGLALPTATVSIHRIGDGAPAMRTGADRIGGAQVASGDAADRDLDAVLVNVAQAIARIVVPAEETATGTPFTPTASQSEASRPTLEAEGLDGGMLQDGDVPSIGNEAPANSKAASHTLYRKARSDVGTAVVEERFEHAPPPAHTVADPHAREQASPEAASNEPKAKRREDVPNADALAVQAAVPQGAPEHAAVVTRAPEAGSVARAPETGAIALPHGAGVRAAPAALRSPTALPENVPALDGGDMRSVEAPRSPQTFAIDAALANGRRGDAVSPTPARAISAPNAQPGTEASGPASSAALSSAENAQGAAAPSTPAGLAPHGARVEVSRAGTTQRGESESASYASSARASSAASGATPRAPVTPMNAPHADAQHARAQRDLGTEQQSVATPAATAASALSTPAASQATSKRAGVPQVPVRVASEGVASAQAPMVEPNAPTLGVRGEVRFESGEKLAPSSRSVVNPEAGANVGAQPQAMTARPSATAASPVAPAQSTQVRPQAAKQVRPQAANHDPRARLDPASETTNVEGPAALPSSARAALGQGPQEGRAPERNAALNAMGSSLNATRGAGSYRDSATAQRALGGAPVRPANGPQVAASEGTRAGVAGEELLAANTGANLRTTSNASGPDSPIDEATVHTSAANGERRAGAEQTLPSTPSAAETAESRGKSDGKVAEPARPEVSADRPVVGAEVAPPTVQQAAARAAVAPLSSGRDAPAANVVASTIGSEAAVRTRANVVQREASSNAGEKSKERSGAMTRVEGFSHGSRFNGALAAYGGRGHQGAEHASREEREGEREWTTGSEERATPAVTFELPQPALLAPAQQAPRELPRVDVPPPPAAPDVQPPPELPEFEFGRTPGSQPQAASISIHHPDLGPIEIQVQRRLDKVEVSAVIESTHAEAVLRANESGIRLGVQQSGMTFSALRVKLRGEDSKVRDNARTGAPARKRPVNQRGI